MAWPDALELLLTGETIDAERAKETGLAWKVIPHDDLMTEARTLADRLCAGAPLAVRATNEMARRGRTLPWTEAVRMGETMRRVGVQYCRRSRGHGRLEGRPPPNLASPLARRSGRPRRGRPGRADGRLLALGLAVHVLD